MKTTLTILAATALSAPLGAQSLEQRVRQAPDGLVRLSFAAREGVCGNGRNINWQERSNKDGWRSDCEHGPVRVALEVMAGQVYEVRSYVGGRWGDLDRKSTDLGSVPARVAGEFFLALAGSGRDVKGDALVPAILADSISAWPELLRIAKNTSVKSSVRKQAVFWLSQEASTEATRGLAEIAENERGEQDLRKQAVFALSQLKNGEGVPTMIRLARSDRDPVIRKQAIFWLGQSGDPRAVEFFEEILTRRR